MSLTITIPGAVNVTTGAMAPAVLTVGVGVPGAQGPAGPGVPVGGTAGQYLQKIDGTNYNTDWVTLNLAVYAVKSNNLSDLTSAPDARTNLGLGTMATATAADYSTTTVANGLYYPLSTNPAGYLTSASLTGYATESWVTAGFYPLTGNPSGFITSSALTPYLTSATAASTYQTLSGMSSYLTTSAAASTYLTQSNAATTYYPLTGNPSGFITSSALSPYLTSATAASTYATILEPSVDGILTVEPSGSNTATVNVNQDANNYIHLRAGVGQIVMVYGGATKWFFNDTYLQFPGGSQQTVAYPGSSGFLLKADNLSGLANTGTARTNLGLGTMAVETASNYLTTASAASTYAPLASPTFTGTPTLPTGTIATTQTAGNNTTAVATTAFVTAAVPAFATFTTPGVNSTTTAVSPRVAMDYLMHPGRTEWLKFGNSATSGTGASVGSPVSTRSVEVIGPNAGVAGYAMGIWDTSFAGWGMLGMTRGVNMGARAWNKGIWASGRGQIGYYDNNTYNGDANTTVRVSVGGKSAPSSGSISSSENGFGWLVPGVGNAMQLQVSNGTTVTTVTSSFTPVTKELFDWKLFSDGTGNVTLWINDNVVATTTGGPSTATAENYNFYFEMVEQTASAATRIIWESLNSRVWWGV